MSTCNSCGGSGVVYSTIQRTISRAMGSQEYEAVAPCPCQRIPGAHRRLRRASYPPRAIEALEGNLQDTTSVRSAREWAAGVSTCLTLLGDKGAGKTLGATLGVRDLLAQDPARTAAYLHCARVTRLTAWRIDDLVDSLCEAGVLLLDDLGTETSTWWASTLDEILDHRYQHRRRTVITCNLTPERFALHVGARVHDRLRTGRIVACPERSLRRPEHEMGGAR